MRNNSLMVIYNLDKVDDLNLSECKEKIKLLEGLLNSMYNSPRYTFEINQCINLINARKHSIQRRA